MSVFVCGDTHGSIDINKLTTKEWSEQKKLTKDDLLIILGDYGGFWANERTKEEQYWLEWFTAKNFTTCFIDGNHCLSKNTEVLTEYGWFFIKDIINRKDIKIAQFDIKSKIIDYTYPLNSILKISDNLIIIEGDNTYQEVTPEHDIVFNGAKIKASSLLGKVFKEDSFILSGNYIEKPNIDIEIYWIKLLTHVIMDGTIIDYSKYSANSKKKTIQFKLSKERKIKELQKLLDTLDIPYTIKPATKSKCNKLQPYLIRVYSDYARSILSKLNNKKEFPKEWIDLSKEQLQACLETISITDGTKTTGIIWRSTNKNNVDVIQQACVTNDMLFKYKTYTNKSGFKNGKEQYICSIYNKLLHLNNKPYVRIHKIPYNDMTYCFNMPKGTLITRTFGKVSFTGNCNFNIINKFQKVDFCEGKAGLAYQDDNGIIFHLKRGEIYNFEGKKVLTFGGADSVDKERRLLGQSWWPEEVPNFADVTNLDNNLKLHNNEVDFILTHTCPKSIIVPMGLVTSRDCEMVGYKQHDPTTEILQSVLETVKFKEWHMAHFHKVLSYEKRFFCHYNNAPVKII